MLKICITSMGMLFLGLAAARAAQVQVTIDNFMFMPAKVAAHPGDVILFVNKDTDPHTASALDGKSFESGPINPGDQWSFTVKAAGTYRYRCDIHPDMLGEIDVK
jgi:plastocyanin